VPIREDDFATIERSDLHLGTQPVRGCENARRRVRVIFITIWNTDSKPDCPMMVGMQSAQDGWSLFGRTSIRIDREVKARLDASGFPPTADIKQDCLHVR
jgi:hypothetical protein